MPRAIDLTNQRFGRLLVIGLADHKGVKRRWRCLCDCGHETLAHTHDLMSGHQRGCKHDPRPHSRFSKPYKTHGMAGTPEHLAWINMNGRCKPTHERAKDYFARGITVCAEWRSDFLAFYHHIGPRPTPDHSLDRINNDGNYEPGNVRWATRSQQTSNARHAIHPRDPVTGRFL